MAFAVYNYGDAAAAAAGGVDEGAHAVMDGADDGAAVVYPAFGGDAQAAVIGDLEGYARGLAVYQVAAFGVEGAVDAAQVLGLGTGVGDFGFVQTHYGLFGVVVALGLGFLIYGKDAGVDAFLTEVEHVVGVGTHFIESAGVFKGAA